MEEALLKLKEQRGVTLANLDRLMMYQKYLEGVVEKATQYHEINDLILRFSLIGFSYCDLVDDNFLFMNYLIKTIISIILVVHSLSKLC